MVTSDICLFVGSDYCTTSLLDYLSSAEQSVYLHLGALAGGLSATMLPHVPSLDSCVSEDRTEYADKTGVG